MSQTVWFITGVSSGFGRELALYALQAGHAVYGTVRNLERAADAVSTIEAAGGTCVVLDVNNLESIPSVINAVLTKEGKIDVLVNNAGYGQFGTLEDLSFDDVKLQMQTNFFGPTKIIQSVVPHMRQRKSGTIVNLSSVGGIYSFPGSAVYSASKFALEGLSEALHVELSPFNISVLIVEPGYFRTDFLGGAHIKPYSEAYKGTPTAQLLDLWQSVGGKQPGDPPKAAKVIFDAVAGGPNDKLAGKVVRLPLGSDASMYFGQKLESLKADYEKTKELAKTTDRDDAKLGK